VSAKDRAEAVVRRCGGVIFGDSRQDMSQLETEFMLQREEIVEELAKFVEAAVLISPHGHTIAKEIRKRK
jgi:hypothetical protein